MKKLIASILCAAAALCCAVSFSACSETEEGLSFYMPDGAPALAASMLMAEDTDLGEDVNYYVVDSTDETKGITTYVTGENPKADICILPVNAAAKLLGTGETYQLLGTVTHGNLYIVSKTETTEITTSNLSSLIGKTVGVVNLSNVPGLTFEVILNDNNISYNIVGNDNSTSSTAVNLVAMSAATDLTSFEYDYYVIPEPAMTTLTNKVATLTCLGSLQELYGNSNGYPQAVLVAKNSVIENNSRFIENLMSAMSTAATWVQTADVETIVNAINAHYDTTSNLSTANLNSTVIANCAISFTTAQDSKAEIQGFLTKYAEVATDGATYATADKFFYGYSAS